MTRAAQRRATAKPKTVAERRRAIRRAKGEALPAASVTSAAIDLASPTARKALAALFPRPESDTMIEATPELERAALDYIEARDAAKLADEKKDAAGNVLCNSIGKNLGAAGDGWKAEWGLAKGSVDWTALARDLSIPDETIAKYRRPGSRVLTVHETADE